MERQNSTRLSWFSVFVGRSVARYHPQPRGRGYNLRSPSPPEKVLIRPGLPAVIDKAQEDPGPRSQLEISARSWWRRVWRMEWGRWFGIACRNYHETGSAWPAAIGVHEIASDAGSRLIVGRRPDREIPAHTVPREPSEGVLRSVSWRCRVANSRLVIIVMARHLVHGSPASGPLVAVR